MKVGEVRSEVVVESGEESFASEADKPVEVRVEELREVVREILREELERLHREHGGDAWT